MAPSSLLLASLLGATALAAASNPKVVSMPIRRAAPHERVLRKRDTITSTLYNTIAYGGYLTNVTIGTPPQTMSVVLDTGSSDLWVFGPESCDARTSPCAGGVFDYQESTTIDILHKPFRIQYETPGSGVEGGFVTDDVTIGGATIKNAIFAVATGAKYTNTGIFGVSFPLDESLTATEREYTNILGMMVNQGLISTHAYSLYLDDLSSSTGSILFGGYDTAKYDGDLIAIPIQADESSGEITSMSVAWTSLSITDAGGNRELLTPSNFAQSTVLDSGTTLTLVPQTYYNTLAKYFETEDAGNGLVLVSCDLANNQGSVDFGFGGKDGPVISVPFSELAVPLYGENGKRESYQDGSPACYFGLAAPEGNEQTLFGDTFLRSAYVVYNLDAKEIALAQTKFDVSDSSIQEISNSNSFGASTTVTGVVVSPTPYSPVAATPAATPNNVTPVGPYTSQALPGGGTIVPAGATGAGGTTSTGAASHSMPGDAFFGEGLRVSVVVAALVGLGGLYGLFL